MQTTHRETPPTTYRLSLRDRLPGPLGALLGAPWWQLGVALFVAWLMAGQINTPNSRIIKALAGFVLFVFAYRAKPFYALCFIVLLFPFPFSIFIGSSTMIFITLTAVIYLARLTMRQVEPLGRTPVDVGIGFLVACYILSFYNIDNPQILRGAVLTMFEIIASLILFYMVATFVRTEAQLRTIVRILVITIGLTVFVGMYELFFPGRVLIPHWILYTGARTAGAAGYRVGGPLNDYELFGEFMAIGFFLVVFVARRSQRPNQRILASALAVLCVFMLLTTVTRGATLSFLGGAVYFLWAIRRGLKPRDILAMALVSISVYFVLDFFVANFTRSGSVFDRMFATTFVGGLPETRSGWPAIWERAMAHPWVGHGPFYDLGLDRGFTGKGLYTYLYPHNQYLYYVHTIGLIGVSAFLFVTGRLLWLSFHLKAPTLRETSYARSLMVVLHVMLLIFLVDQIKIDYLRNPIYQYFPWLLMGLIAATHRIIHNEGKTGGDPVES